MQFFKLSTHQKSTKIFKAAKLFSASLVITINVSWAANQQMISEGSCDTEDWSNDAENSALPSQE